MITHPRSVPWTESGTTERLSTRVQAEGRSLPAACGHRGGTVVEAEATERHGRCRWAQAGRAVVLSVDGCAGASPSCRVGVRTSAGPWPPPGDGCRGAGWAGARGAEVRVCRPPGCGAGPGGGPQGFGRARCRPPSPMGSRVLRPGSHPQALPPPSSTLPQ